MQNSPQWANARNILAVRLDNLGDVLMTGPALTAVKEGAAGARLTLLASKAGAAAAAHVPAVDDTIVYAAPWTKQPRNAGRHDTDRRLIDRLAQAGFDAAIIFTVCTQSALPAALLCRLAGIPLRLAYSRENPYELLTDWIADTEACAAGMRHEVSRQLDLVRSVGFRPRRDHLVFRLNPVETASGMRKFKQAGGEVDAPYIVVHPGASAMSRRYPAERFGAAAQAIAEATGCQVVYTGGRDERDVVARAMSAMRRPSISLAGQLDLGELGALIAQAGLVLCNNTGPAHISAAVGTPVVVLYALTNPQHTPWKSPARVLSHDVECRNCLKSICPEGHHRCLEGVTVHAVVQAALELLDASITKPERTPVALASWPYTEQVRLTG